MDEAALQKQEQITMQNEKELEELAEREQDIRRLEVTSFLLILFQGCERTLQIHYATGSNYHY